MNQSPGMVSGSVSGLTATSAVLKRFTTRKTSSCGLAQELGKQGGVITGVETETVMQ
jgi:hypothetical protein